MTQTQLETDLRMKLEERLQFETFLVDLSAGFAGLPADQVDGAIEDAQRRIVESLALDRSALFQFSPEGEMILTHSWVRPGLQPFPPRISAREHFPWFLAKALRGEIIRFSSVNELPPEAARDTETLRKYGPKSNVTFPLVADGRLFGWTGVWHLARGACTGPMTWFPGCGWWRTSLRIRSRESGARRASGRRSTKCGS